MQHTALITGGSGYIGSYLANRLMAQNTQVHILDIAPPQFDGTIYHAQDVGDAEWIRLLPKTDIVYHLAAVSRIEHSIASPAQSFHTNCTGTLHVMEYAAKHGAAVVYVSTSCCYDALNLSPYHHTKWLGEQVCELYAKHCNANVGIARLFNVYGAHSYHREGAGLVIDVFEDCLRHGRPLPLMSSGRMKRDFIHVHDVAEALMAIGASPRRGEVFDIGTGKLSSIKELVEWFDAPIQHVPGRSFDVAERFGNVTETQTRLQWHPTIGLKDYIKDRVQKIRG